MVYEVELERSAKRGLRRLSKDGFVRVVAAIKGLAENPRPGGCRKIAGAAGDWRIRIGDYRVIYEIDDGAKVVRVMQVRHRGEAYR